MMKKLKKTEVSPKEGRSKVEEQLKKSRRKNKEGLVIKTGW